MTFTIDSNQFREVATAAIFDSLTQEARESIIKQAIEHLMTPQTPRYGGKTPLQESFDQAVYAAARDVVKEHIQDSDEVRNAIHDLLGPLLTAALDAEAKNYSSSLADKLGAALGEWLYEISNSRGD